MTETQNNIETKQKNPEQTQQPEKQLIKIQTEQYCIKYRNVSAIDINPQVKRLQTIVRKSDSCSPENKVGGNNRPDFVFAADRLIRLVVEHGLDMLPVQDKTVTEKNEKKVKNRQKITNFCKIFQKSLNSTYFFHFSLQLLENTTS